jgi:ribosomal protein L16/L10AE
VAYHTDHLSLSVPTGRVIFEIGGAPIREELAREGKPAYSSRNPLLIRHIALRQASTKLPTKMEFINRSTPKRLGNLLITDEAETSIPEAALAVTPEAAAVPSMST